MEKNELKNVLETCFLGEFALIRRTYVCLAKFRVKFGLKYRLTIWSIKDALKNSNKMPRCEFISFEKYRLSMKPFRPLLINFAFLKILRIMKE